MSYIAQLNRALDSYKDNPDFRQRRDLELEYRKMEHDKYMERLRKALAYKYQKKLMDARKPGTGIGGVIGGTLGAGVGAIFGGPGGAMHGWNMGQGLGRIGEGLWSGNMAGQNAFPGLSEPWWDAWHGERKKSKDQLEKIKNTKQQQDTDALIRGSYPVDPDNATRWMQGTNPYVLGLRGIG